ncbi:hypothetical protein [Spirulina subsalsa]|uniref:hypothetical protein n=1 Tax=Spirulina subsalsa TaxID=54311 RepID=UPI0002D74D64|nr:hypothetical protein [Spirulina subsalsa]
MNTLTSSLTTQLSHKDLTLKADKSGAKFTIQVTNQSDKFASFQIEILAAGLDQKASKDWWTIAPEVSTKKPPGDSTEFAIEIVKSPLPGFAGLVNLTVRIFSIELQVEDRHVIRLTVESDGITALKGELPVTTFQAIPGAKIDIPLRLLNPSKGTVTTQVNLLGLPPAWHLSAESQKTIDLTSQQWHELELSVEIPSLSGHSSALRTQSYSFHIEATPSQGMGVKVGGEIEILPSGNVFFAISPKEQRVPVASNQFRFSDLLPKRQVPPAIYTLTFTNQSNIAQQVSANILKYQREEDRKACTLEVVPSEETVNPQETQELELIAQPRRPWVGLSKKLLLELSGVISDERVTLENPDQQVELEVFPIIPRWWQGVLALLVVLCLWWLWGFKATLREHSAPVNVVRLNGLGDWVLSGSNDQTVRRWGVQNARRLEALGVFTATEKAVRTLHYRPVDNNVMAMGLETGEVQLWDLLGQRTTPQTLVFQRDDRVLDLEFTQDSRYLFSGHGSGLVLKWDVGGSQRLTTPAGPQLQQQLDFAIYDLALVGPGEDYLAIAGRYNQLLLWDWSENERQTINYPTGGQDDYITSLATSRMTNLLATADNQGRIMIWDLEGCLGGNSQDCSIVDQWEQDEQKAVRSVAMSQDGCYLASGGDDGRLMLWVLTETGRRAGKYISGQVIARQRAKINAVDLLLVNDRVVLVMGDDQGKVRLYSRRREATSCR